MKCFPYILCCVLLCCLAFPQVDAQTDFWQQVSSTRLGQVFARHPDGSMYVGAFGSGLYHSTDDGLQWTPIAVPYPNIMTLYIHTNGDIYLGMDGGSSPIYRSTDGGSNWSGLPIPAPFVMSVVVTPSGTIFAGAMTSYNDKGLYQSDDGGATWTKLGRFKRFLSGERSVSQLLVGPGGEIFMVMDNGGAYVSRTNGRTWSKLGLANFARISLSLGATCELVAACGAGNSSGYHGRVYRSTTLGRRWQRIDGGAFPVYRLTSAAVVGSTIFVGSIWNGVYQSINHGATWTQVNSGFAAPNEYIDNFGVSSDNHILVSAGRIYRSAQPISTNHPGAVKENDIDELPAQFSLHQNYPNPFNPTTTIEFELVQDALVTAKVYNTIGQEVATLANKEEFGEGTNELEFNASNLPSGVYYYKIVAADVEGKSVLYSNVKKMLLLK